MSRMEEITTELGKLCAELQRIAERAAPLVEELENDFGASPTLRPEVPVETAAMFHIFQKLITQK